MSTWTIRVRDNATLNIIEPEIDTYESFTYVGKWNGAGAWALTMRMQDPKVANFLPDGSGNLHHGILFFVDNLDGNGPQLVMSGPQTSITVSLAQDGTYTALITGFDDNYWLLKRRAVQAPTFPYLTSWPKGAFYQIGIAGPVRFYPLNESAGAVATDVSDSPVNGAYNGGFTLAQPGLIDDPSTCTKLNGTTGYISSPTAGLAVGNNAWILFAWGMLTANPGIKATLGWVGTNALKQGCQMGVNTSGTPYISTSGVADVAGPTAVPLNTPFLLGLSWDGTTLTGWLNGVPFAAQAPGVLNIAYGTLSFGALGAGASNFWPGYLGMGGFFNFDVGLNSATWPQIYLTGISRQAFLNYDTRTGQASTIMRQYVDVNGGPSARPSTAFTNWQVTQTARQIPNISLAADPALGSTLTGLARQDVLLYLLGALALQSSPELGFKVQQSGATLSFSIFTARDQSATAVFSLDRGNIVDYTWQYSVAQANHIIAGGQNPTPGTLTGRVWGVKESATSISQFGYLEDFLNYQQTTSGATLQQALTGQLATDAQQININATLKDLPPVAGVGGLYFMGPGAAGYRLGDKVAVILDGQTFTQILRQIQIDLQPGAPAVVTPAIGTPVAAEIMQEYQTIQANQAAAGMDVWTLQSNF